MTQPPPPKQPPHPPSLRLSVSSSLLFKIKARDKPMAAAFLSNGDSQLLQHSRPLLPVLVPRHPEVVLVLHDVGQHGAAQEHHVLTPRGVLDPDLEFLPLGMRRALADRRSDMTTR